MEQDDRHTMSIRKSGSLIMIGIDVSRLSQQLYQGLGVVANRIIRCQLYIYDHHRLKGIKWELNYQ